jgi:hypothetical protein
VGALLIGRILLVAVASMAAGTTTANAHELISVDSEVATGLIRLARPGSEVQPTGFAMALFGVALLLRAAAGVGRSRRSRQRRRTGLRGSSGIGARHARREAPIAAVLGHVERIEASLRAAR